LSFENLLKRSNPDEVFIRKVRADGKLIESERVNLFYGPHGSRTHYYLFYLRGKLRQSGETSKTKAFNVLRSLAV